MVTFYIIFEMLTVCRYTVPLLFITAIELFAAVIVDFDIVVFRGEKLLLKRHGAVLYSVGIT